MTTAEASIDWRSLRGAGAALSASGAGAGVAGSPTPAGRMDSGRSWAIAGIAAASARAAAPINMCLVGGSIARDVCLDCLDWHFLRAPRQEEQPAGQQEDQNHQENQASRHGG